MRILKNPYSPKGKNELTPGQVQSLGADNFYRIESKCNISPKDLNDIREWFNDNLSQPYAIQKGYGNYAFNKTGNKRSSSLIFYFASEEDFAYFKLLHPEIVNG